MLKHRQNKLLNKCFECAVRTVIYCPFHWMYTKGEENRMLCTRRVSNKNGLFDIDWYVYLKVCSIMLFVAVALRTTIPYSYYRQTYTSTSLAQWTLSLYIYIYGTLTPSHKSGKKWGKVSGPLRGLQVSLHYVYICNM